MKISQKIICGLLVSGCLLNQATQALPVNAYVGASMGFQRGWGSLKGGTLLDFSGVVIQGGGLGQASYSGHIGQSDPAANLFFEVSTKLTNQLSLGVRPYYHLDGLEVTVSKNGDLSKTMANTSEITELSLRRRHAYGILFAPKISFKEITAYALLGAEFSRFRAKISRAISIPGAPTGYFNFPKGIFASAVVLGLGVSKDLDNWSLFMEGQYKHYQTKSFSQGFIADGAPTSQSLKFSPKFASLMFGVKYKIC